MSDKIELEWEAPPPKTQASVYDDVIREVTKRPGSWARVRSGLSSSGASSATQNLRKLLAARDPKWEVVNRRIDHDSKNYGVWIRLRTREQMRDGENAQ
jgi:hypothetical protein